MKEAGVHFGMKDFENEVSKSSSRVLQKLC